MNPFHLESSWNDKMRQFSYMKHNLLSFKDLLHPGFNWLCLFPLNILLQLTSSISHNMPASNICHIHCSLLITGL